MTLKKILSWSGRLIMTRYNFEECVPRENGFYKLYDIKGRIYAGYWDALCFEVGPLLKRETMIEDTSPIDIGEWEEWE
jgi:hypothetical protein